MAQTNRLKILFVFDHEYPHLWRDGLWAALKILEKDWDIEYLNLNDDIIGKGPHAGHLRFQPVPVESTPLSRAGHGAGLSRALGSPKS